MLLLSVICSLNVSAQQLVSIDFNNVIVCPEINKVPAQPTFTEAHCQPKQLHNVNPQNTSLWIKAPITLVKNERKQQALALYVFGKSSSEVYFNGHFLGKNGTPDNIAEKEFVGNMDVKFYLPTEFINDGSNEVVMHLSAHHGFIELRSPVSFIGVGEYGNTISYFQKNIGISLILLGALLLGAIYFAALTFSAKTNNDALLFFLMALFASGQLFAEIARGLFNYTYPFHDLRLILIAALSFCFGINLLIYITNKFPPKQPKKWLLSASITTLLVMVIFPGFDAKTAFAVLIPALFSAALIGVHYKQHRSTETLGYLLLFSLFIVTVMLTLQMFHNLMFYAITTLMMFYLFIKQAKTLVAEQLQLAKLQFTFENNQQLEQPSKLTINSASKTEIISSDNIHYCKAAGDYVEIALKSGGQQLYSGSLKSLERALPKTFLRIHRSYIVNLSSVKTLKTNASAGSNGYLILNNEQELPISRRILPLVRSSIAKL